MRRTLASLAIAATATAFALTAASAAEISGAGATFPYPIYAKWADAYKTETGIGLNYQSIGSGGGIKQIKAKTVDFRRLRQAADGRGARQVRPRSSSRWSWAASCRSSTSRASSPARSCIDGPTLADIYPRQDHQVERSRRSRSSTRASSCRARRSPSVHRSDGSGTTFNFTYYLSRGQQRLEDEGRRRARRSQWPVGIGAKGNEGVANNVAQHQRLDRLCRVRLCAAEQPDLRQDEEQGRQRRQPRPRKPSRLRPPNADWNSKPGFCVSSSPTSRAPAPGR